MTSSRMQLYNGIALMAIFLVVEFWGAATNPSAFIQMYGLTSVPP
jgi:hypothetical protein